jgi:amino acid permease
MVFCHTQPHDLAGIVPGVIIIIFMGAFALYTAKLLIDFKLNHPTVHNMGMWVKCI